MSRNPRSALFRALLLGAAGALPGLAGTSAAAPPTAQEIPIQGVVLDTTGAVVANGDLTVRVYADSTGGSPLLEEAFPGAIAQGIFNVTVGTGGSLQLDDETLHYLEIDAGGAAVVGATGRERFYPGGGSHARPDLEARLDTLEAVMGVSESPGSPASRGPQAQAGSREAASSYSLAGGLLGIGWVGGSGLDYSVSATLLLQPVGVRQAGGIRALLGPAYLPPPAVQVGIPDRRPSARFALHRARPNPARSLTTISYDLPRDSVVRLEVYDVQGRCARILVDGAAEAAGSHGIQWDGRDDSGRRVPPGVYYLHLRAGSGTSVGKLVVLP